MGVLNAPAPPLYLRPLPPDGVALAGPRRSRRTRRPT